MRWWEKKMKDRTYNQWWLNEIANFKRHGDTYDPTSGGRYTSSPFKSIPVRMMDSLLLTNTRWKIIKYVLKKRGIRAALKVLWALIFGTTLEKTD